MSGGCRSCALSDIVGGIPGSLGINVEDENALREKLITLLYFGYGGAGNSAITENINEYLEKYLAASDIPNDHILLFKSLYGQEKSDEVMKKYWYRVTQELIFSAIDVEKVNAASIKNGTKLELGYSVFDYETKGTLNAISEDSATYTGIKTVLSNLTYEDVMTHSNGKIYSLGVLVPQGEGANRKQNMITIQGLEEQSSNFQYVDDEVYELPSSGGIGTYWNTIIGTMFLCMAGAFMLRAWANKAPVKAGRIFCVTGDGSF